MSRIPLSTEWRRYLSDPGTAPEFHQAIRNLVGQTVKVRTIATDFGACTVQVDGVLARETVYFTVRHVQFNGGEVFLFGQTDQGQKVFASSYLKTVTTPGGIRQPR